jgi:NADH dehydrogenase (ubiquinone) Fe-S protein 6
MLQRSARRLVPVLGRRTVAVRSPYSTTTDNPTPANNPNPKPTPPTVSSTNALPTSATGNKDAALVEDPAEGEAKRVMQAPNRAKPWSRSQQPREKAMVGPRFEQTIMEDQVRHVAGNRR